MFKLNPKFITSKTRNIPKFSLAKSFSRFSSNEPGYSILFYDYVPNIVERRAPYRPEHLKYTDGYKEKGNLLLAGAFANPVDGAALIFKGLTQQEVEAFAKGDPYVKNGLVTKWKVREWSVVVSSLKK